jgi:hypothetical protein
VRDGVVEAALDACELAEHRFAADVEPGVVDDLEPPLNPVAFLGGADDVSCGDCRSGGEERVGRLVPWPVEPVVQVPCPVGERQRLFPLAAV